MLLYISAIRCSISKRNSSVSSNNRRNTNGSSNHDWNSNGHSNNDRSSNNASGTAKAKPMTGTATAGVTTTKLQDRHQQL